MASPNLPFFGAALAPQLPAIAGVPDLDVLPNRVTKKTGAALLSRFKFPVTARALQDWDDVDWLVLNGKATAETSQLFAAADRRVAAARHRSRT